MSPESRANARLRSGFPRVSGDEPTREYAAACQWLFSPRERG